MTRWMTRREPGKSLERDQGPTADHRRDRWSMMQVGGAARASITVRGVDEASVLAAVCTVGGGRPPWLQPTGSSRVGHGLGHGGLAPGQEAAGSTGGREPGHRVRAAGASRRGRVGSRRRGGRGHGGGRRRGAARTRAPGVRHGLLPAGAGPQAGGVQCTGWSGDSSSSGRGPTVVLPTVGTGVPALGDGRSGPLRAGDGQATTREDPSIGPVSPRGPEQAVLAEGAHALLMAG